MILNQQQFIGSICPYSQQLQGNGCFNASGNFLSQEGSFAGDGVFSGNGTVVINGFFVFYDGSVVSGVASGFNGNSIFDLQNTFLPFASYSGYGVVSGSHVLVSGPNGIGQFVGTDFFSIAGSISGLTIQCLVTGTGPFSGSGSWVLLDGYIQNSGNTTGCGTIQGVGIITQFTPNSTLPTCYVCSSDYYGAIYQQSNLFSSGQFNATGDPYTQYDESGNFIAFNNALISGSGTYYSQSAWIVENFSGGIAGGGDYFNLYGAFSGFSDGIFWGAGFCTGTTVYYNEGSFDTGNGQGFYGSGFFSVTGYIRGVNGYYAGSGSGKGQGWFEGGIVETLAGATNVMSGSGCFLGVGTVYMTDISGNISGIACLTDNYASQALLPGCGSFPPFPTICGTIGTLALDFEYNGGCVFKT